MKKLKLFGLSSVMLLLLTACGTTEGSIDNTKRFDLWEYMKTPINYRVTYDIYENGQKIKFYEEDHRLLNYDTYERVSNDGVTTLSLNGGEIVMEEPSSVVKINHFVYLGDENIFRGEFINNCTFDQYYKNYEVKGEIFHEVLMVSCTSVSGVQEEYYYGYNEGIVYKYTNDRGSITERVKVHENRI